MEQTVNQRLKIFFDSQGITQKRIAKEIKTTEQTISLTFKGKTTPKSDLLERVCKVYINLNPTWLLTGEGEMLRSDGNFTPPSNPASMAVTESMYKAKYEEMVKLYEEAKGMIKFLQSVMATSGLGKSKGRLIQLHPAMTENLRQAA